MIHFWELGCVLCVLLLVSNIWLYFRVLRPIQRLAAQASELSTGNFSSIDRETGGIAEIQSLRRSMVSMVRHVRRAQHQSVKYADNLTEVQEAERLRIARELHDDTIQSLIAISQSIDMAKAWISSMPEQAMHMLGTAREQAVETVSNLRGLIEDLRPPALEELGLVTALQMQTEKCELPVELIVEGQPRRLNEIQELALFRSVQETLSNARRHSQAKQVNLCLSYYPHTVQILVSDNGRGFKLPQQLTELADDGHYGLMGIQERVKQLDGTLEIHSARGKGTRIRLEIPSEPAPQPDDAVRDPVCSAVIQPHQAYASTLHSGERYYFCCPICQGAFQKDPAQYIQTSAAAHQYAN